MINIVKLIWEAEFKYIYQLFIAVVASKTDYVACIWHRSENHRSQAQNQATQLIKVQRLAMKAIIRYFRTISTMILEI